MHILNTMSKGSFNYASCIKPVWLQHLACRCIFKVNQKNESFIIMFIFYELLSCYYLHRRQYVNQNAVHISPDTLGPPYEWEFLPCPFCCPRGPLHWQWCHLFPGGTPPSDLWLGKTDELLLPPCFFARSILHVGVCFMNDGDLLKPSIQLPKDTALAPIAPTRQE